MGIVLAGAATVYGSPPGAEKAQYELAVDVGHYGLSPETVVILEAASERAWQQAWNDTAVERARVMDTLGITQAIAELKANAVNHELVYRLIEDCSVHRWRGLSKSNVPDNKIYRPGWNRKVCEG